jgi:hypothetical protein
VLTEATHWSNIASLLRSLIPGIVEEVDVIYVFESFIFATSSSVCRGYADCYILPLTNMPS